MTPVDSASVGEGRSPCGLRRVGAAPVAQAYVTEFLVELCESDSAHD